MFGANKSTGLALTVALLLSQTIAFADESSSTTVQTNNGLGSTKAVSTESSNGAETKSASYKAEVGSNGAKIESNKNAIRANADGSVTSAHQHESHAINAAGSAHVKQSSSTTLNPDGSNTSVKEEHTSVHQ